MQINCFYMQSESGEWRSTRTFQNTSSGIDKQGKRQGLLKSDTALDAAIIYFRTFRALLRQRSVPRRQPILIYG